MLDYFSLLGNSSLVKGQEDLFKLLGFRDYLLITFTVVIFRLTMDEIFVPSIWQLMLVK
jgi:hypothetical protein